MIPQGNKDVDRLLLCVEKITNPRIKQATLKCLENAPEYFWKTPASITGKYHPQWALGEGGLIRHTLAIVDVGINMARYDVEVEPQTFITIVPACILHDITKYGINDTPESLESDPQLYWYKNHHITGATFCRSVWYNNVFPAGNSNNGSYADETLWLEVCNLIVGHAGRWGIKPVSKTGWVLHLSDLAVSTRLSSDIYVSEN
jgi:hypothetical protein